MFKQKSSIQMDHAVEWRALQIFNSYRLCLALLLIVLHYFTIGYIVLGQADPFLYQAAVSTYLFFALLAITATHFRWMHFKQLVFSQLFVDSVILILLQHASGGVSSGLSILLNITIVASSMLTTTRSTLLLASIVWFALFAEHMVFGVRNVQWSGGVFQVGLLGASFFATALLGHIFSKRARFTEALAEERGSKLASMEQLNAYILQRMNSAIVVIDENKRMRLMNDAANELLKTNDAQNQITEELSKTHKPPFSRTVSINNADYSMRIRYLGEPPITLVYLDDVKQHAHEVQQMKLASLGRFTASIAHELRNPLGAVGHAAQLLEESEHLNVDDRRLVDIIGAHTDRMNSVIKNILQLSRREQTNPSEINLRCCLDGLIKDFSAHEHNNLDIKTEIKCDDIKVWMDASQLNQVMTNLCENGTRHSHANGGISKLLVRAGLHEEAAPYVEIVDYGQGVAVEHEQHIFEPFFTTNQFGTGLGL